MDADNLPGSADGTIQDAINRLNANSEQSGLPTEEVVEETTQEPEEAQSAEAELAEEEAEAEEAQEAQAQPEAKAEPESEEISEDEKELGYLRDKDYRQKTMSLAEERKANDSKTAELDAKLNQAAQLLDFQSSTENWQELKEYDPEAYVEKKEALEAKAKQYQELVQTRQEASQKQYQEYVANQVKVLPEKIPEWLDEEKAVAELTQVRKFMVDNGYSQQEAASTIDHRAIVLTRKAMLYDQIMSAKPETKEVKTKLKSAKPSVPKTSEQKEGEKLHSKRAKLKKSGRIQDAGSAIKDLYF